MTTRAVLGWAAGAALLMLCAPAQALVVTERTDELAYFEAEGCGLADSATVTLPSGARRIEPVAPRVGQAIEDLGDTSIVARFASIERLRLGRRRVSLHGRWECAALVKSAASRLITGECFR